MTKSFHFKHHAQHLNVDLLIVHNHDKWQCCNAWFHFCLCKIRDELVFLVRHDLRCAWDGYDSWISLNYTTITHQLFLKVDNSRLKDGCGWQSFHWLNKRMLLFFLVQNILLLAARKWTVTRVLVGWFYVYVRFFGGCFTRSNLWMKGSSNSNGSINLAPSSKTRLINIRQHRHGEILRSRSEQCISIVCCKKAFILEMWLIKDARLIKFDSCHLHSKGERATAANSSWLYSNSTATTLHYLLDYMEAKTDTTAVLLRGSMHLSKFLEHVL